MIPVPPKARPNTWTSSQPLGFEGGDENLYRYVGNSPANFTDPSGLTPAGTFIITYPNGDIKSFGPQTSPSVIRSILENNRGARLTIVDGPQSTTVPNELKLYLPQEKPAPRPKLHPLDPKNPVKPFTKDIRRVIEMAQGDRNAERALGTLFQQIARTPLQGFYGQTPNKCFNFLDDFLRKNYPKYGRDSKGRIILEGGALVLEPLEVPTRGGKQLVTSRSAFGKATGSMTDHGIIRGTFYRDGKPAGVFYFDLGSSTHLGNYGGSDHFFFDDAEGFLVEMDLNRAQPYYPE